MALSRARVNRYLAAPSIQADSRATLRIQDALIELRGIPGQIANETKEYALEIGDILLTMTGTKG